MKKKILGIGNAIVDIFAHVDHKFLKENNLVKSSMKLINEDELRICDNTICDIANTLQPKPYSSREFIQEMGRYLEKNAKNKERLYKMYQKRRACISQKSRMKKHTSKHNIRQAM